MKNGQNAKLLPPTFLSVFIRLTSLLDRGHFRRFKGCNDKYFMLIGVVCTPTKTMYRSPGLCDLRVFETSRGFCFDYTGLKSHRHLSL